LKNLAVVYSGLITNNGFAELSDGLSAFDIVLNFAAKLPEVESVIVFTGPGFPDSKKQDLKTIGNEHWTTGKLLEHLCAASEGYDHVFYMHGDTPFLDLQKSEAMYANHVKYSAQYSFADGYPYGLTPEIIESRTVKIIDVLSREDNTPVKRDSIFEAMKKDINAFDIETDIAAVDQRLLRVTLAADTNRNTMLLRRMLEERVAGLETVTSFLRTNPESLRTLPAYVDVQIEEGCPQACSYCPWAATAPDVLAARGEMAQEQFVTILEKVSDFCGDATIGISLWGEPSLHSGVAELAGAVKNFENLSLLIETSGVGWRDGDIERVLDAVGDKTEWIVSLDAIDADLYAHLRGEGMKEATDTALRLIKAAGPAVHVQAVRMKESEEKLQDFYRFWKTHTDNIIIQKYDFVSGFLPQRKVTDLSPLNRFPCWHLKRDLNVLLDGSVPVCREDLRCEHTLGNIFTDPLEKIWERGNEWYQMHIAGEYPQLCGDCDEYYTYNF
jgi:spiro-SPASM protein